MAECPFCAGEVDDDLITFGGPCPRCFADIPGEEAATDPGEEVRAALEKQDSRRAAVRALVPLALLMPVVACFGLGALIFFFKKDPEVVVIDFDLLAEFPEPELVGGVEPPGSEPSARNPPSGRSTTGAGSTGTASGPSGDGLVRRGTGDARVPGGGGGLGDRGAPPAQGGLSFGPTATQARSGGMLEDPDLIMRMIQERMSGQVQTLRECYERQLKSDDRLEGRWRITYTVDREGRPMEAAALGLEQKNAEMEACMAKKITAWVFQPIKRPTMVQRTLRFTPN